MLPAIGTIRPWADPTITAIGRGRMHVPLPRPTVMSLDGPWAFARFAHPDVVTEDAIVGPAPQDTVEVPGDWTLQGTEDTPHYTNVRMPFPEVPPHLPQECATAVYRRTFQVPWSGQRVFLRIESAESVHAVYLDGTFVGYGTDSRLPSEYELTPLLGTGTGTGTSTDTGTHELAIVVVRYSAQSYVEDQDQWWLAGLLRPVVLEARPQVHLHDVVCDTDLDPAVGSGTIDVTCEVDAPQGAPQGAPLAAGWSTRVRIIGPDGAPAADVTQVSVPHQTHAPAVFDGHRTRHRFDIADARAWSAETPALYGVEVELLDEAGAVVDRVTTRCGLRRVEVRGRELLVNGAPVWIFGVNRHEHHPERGRAVRVEDMRADLVALRAHNITAVRTAHYPDDHRFYDLCDELGMYVVDEANIEGHAFSTSICRDERYRSSFLERGARMVQRDRNHPCVIMWSLGNETGYGENHDALAGWIRRSDPSRPLHYEGAVFHGDHHDPAGTLPLDVGRANARPVFDPADANPNWIDGGRRASDVVCPMYPPIAAIAKYGADGLGDRPLIMCEYSHAMGNSNGSIADYWDVITSTPGLQGGFVWEWKDHALRDRATGRLMLGGDWGDEPNDGNFVADGLVSADLEPHPALTEVAWVYRPVTTEIRSDTLTVTNRRSFTGLDDLEATWSLLVDGVPAGSGPLRIGDAGGNGGTDVIPPHGSVELPIPPDAAQRITTACSAPLRPEVVLSVTWALRDATWFAPAGHALAWDQAILVEATLPPPLPLPGGTAGPDVELLAATLVHAPEPAVLRAPVDNDGFKLMPQLRDAIGVGGRALARWERTGVLTTPASELVDWTVGTSVVDGGELQHHHIVVPETLDDAGRVGVRFAIPRRFDRLAWYGRGPGENYPDRRRGSMLGRWHSEVDALPYVVPQEYGLRTDTRWMSCSDVSGATVWIRAIDPVSLHLSVVEHPAESLYAASNVADLGASEWLWVHVDVAHRGVGTASCGPDVAPQHRIAAGVYEFTFWLGMTR